MTFREFARETLGWGNWAVCSERSRAAYRFDTCVTPNQLLKAEITFLRSGGDPNNDSWISSKALAAEGYVQRWVKA